MKIVETAHLIERKIKRTQVKKTLQIVPLISLIILIIQSCAYNAEKLEAKMWKRMDRKDNQQYKYAFKHWNKGRTYQQYSGQIISDTSSDVTIIQFDSIRVILYSKDVKFKSIFTSGLVSGQMIYCARNSDCTPPKVFKMIDKKTGEQIYPRLSDWKGHTINAGDFEELKTIKSKPTQRKFKFLVYPSTIILNGISDIFLLELTNTNANNKTDLETFIKDARVTFLAFVGGGV